MDYRHHRASAVAMGVGCGTVRADRRDRRRAEYLQRRKMGVPSGVRDVPGVSRKQTGSIRGVCTGNGRSAQFILAGWAVTYASAGLTLYAIVILTVFHLRILWYEEPRLAAGFGAAWIRYRENVRRWL
jgi:hypothetical protein